MLRRSITTAGKITTTARISQKMKPTIRLARPIRSTPIIRSFSGDGGSSYDSGSSSSSSDSSYTSSNYTSYSDSSYTNDNSTSQGGSWFSSWFGGSKASDSTSSIQVDTSPLPEIPTAPHSNTSDTLLTDKAADGDAHKHKTGEIHDPSSHSQPSYTTPTNDAWFWMWLLGQNNNSNSRVAASTPIDHNKDKRKLINRTLWGASLGAGGALIYKNLDQQSSSHAKRR